MQLTGNEMDKLKDAVFTSCKVAADNGFKLLSLACSKAIFLADREHYLKNGRALIADSYVHGKYWPYLPELRDATQYLTDNGFVKVKNAFYPGFTHEFHEYHLGLRHNDYTVMNLDSKGIKLIEHKTIEVLTCFNDVVDAALATHNHAWNITTEKEPIPLSMQILTTSLPLTEDDFKWAKDTMQEIGI